MFRYFLKCVLLFGVALNTSYSFNIGVISSGFPVLEISDNDTFMKRAISAMAEIPEGMKDAMHGIKMGVSSDICDNAKDGLEIDWDGSAVNYTCYHPKSRFPVLESIEAVEECTLAEKFYAKHVCLNEKIYYEDVIPTYGNHRPLWPVYGEYTFVPPQRWLHNLEHGAVVMLYHPCAEPLEIKKLKKIVKGCLRRHIITPYIHLSAEKPLALVAWGCKLQMNHVDEDIVKKFITTRALHGPEGMVAKQGQYRYKLLEIASPPKGSNYRDIKLCP